MTGNLYQSIECRKRTGRRRAAARWAAAIVFALPVFSASGQILLGPLGQAAGPPTPGFPTTVGGYPTLPGGSSNTMGDANRFKYNLRLDVSALYDTNIFISNTNRVADYQFTISPGVTLGFGDVFRRKENYIRLDYSPSFQFFARNPSQNNIGQAFLLDGVYNTGKATWRFAQGITVLNGADTDVGTRVTRQIYATTVGLSYLVSDKTFVDFSGTFAYQHFHDELDNWTASGGAYLNYIYSPKLTIGLGVVGGYTAVSGNVDPDQTFEQANLKFTYQVTGKILLNATVGVQFLQFQGARSAYVTPVFTVSGVYQPFDGTTVTLTAGRHVQPSASTEGQNFTTTGVTLAIRQRFIQRLYLTLTGGFENSAYFAIVPQAVANRNQDYLTGSIGLDYMVREGWTVGAFYLNRQAFGNAASAPFNFVDNQVGIRSTVSF
jgi:hypothetical protein